jgi:hypothetical protein
MHPPRPALSDATNSTLTCQRLTRPNTAGHRASASGQHIQPPPLRQQPAVVLPQRGHLVDLALQDRRDLAQSQTEFPHQQDLLQPQQLGLLVAAIAPDVRGNKQPDLPEVPQRRDVTPGIRATSAIDQAMAVPFIAGPVFPATPMTVGVDAAEGATGRRHAPLSPRPVTATTDRPAARTNQTVTNGTFRTAYCRALVTNVQNHRGVSHSQRD